MNLFEPVELRVSARIRPCREDDLTTLEWFGLFAPDRPLIRETFDASLRGQAVMLVAEVNGVASGQVWIDLSRARIDRTGVIWALRVFPCLQNLGLGSRLLQAAEHVIRARGLPRAELQVERDNPAARLYRRLGYQLVGEARGPDIDGKPARQSVMRKDLARLRRSRAVRSGV